MNALIFIGFVVAIVIVCYRLQRGMQGCSGDCNQGRKVCNCRAKI